MIMKDVRLEFVDWARDGRCQLTLEDNHIWWHMKGLVTKLSLTTLPKQSWSTGSSFSISLVPVQIHRVNTGHNQ